MFNECYLSLEKYKCKPQLWFAQATKMTLIFLKENDCLRVHEGIRLCGLLCPSKWLVIPQKVNLMTISIGPTSFSSKLHS